MDPDDTDASLNGRTYVIELGHSSYEIAGPLLDSCAFDSTTAAFSCSVNYLP